MAEMNPMTVAVLVFMVLSLSGAAGLLLPGALINIGRNLAKRIKNIL
jgi:hypothetical protein